MNGLVAYSDSSEGEENSPPIKKKKKLVLSNPIKDVQIGQDLECHEDDPSLHEDRIRTFAHVRGNWASYIYIQPEDIDFVPLQNNLVKALSHQDVKLISNPHLSLSKVFTLQYHCISSFTTELKGSFDFEPFWLSLGPQIKLFVNEESTRTFLSIQVPETKSLKASLESCDKTLAEFQKEPFYNPPEFHVSIAWILGNQKQAIDVKSVQKVFDTWAELNEIAFKVNKIQCKIGNKNFDFDLN